jgi:hypothetical protein
VAKYGQLSPADYFRADAAGLAREYGLVVAWIAQAEMEDVPAKEFRKSLEKLRKIGMEFTLESVLGNVLSERIRKNRYRSKTKDLHTLKDVPGTVPEDGTLDGKEDVASRSRIRNSSSTKKSNAKPAAPRYPLSKAACLQAWNDAVTEVTGQPSCVTGQAQMTKAQDFHRVVYGNNESFCDVVRRRVKLGANLTLHWTMNDYANDRQRCAPTLKKTAPDGWNEGDKMNGIPKGVVV